MRERIIRWKEILLNPAADWQFRIFLLGILLFYLLTRLPLLGYKPFHHDESLFSTYAFWQNTLGNYDHHPLLHGPLQIQLLAILYRVFDWIGIMTSHGNTGIRLLSVTCGAILLILIPGFHRKIGREGVVLALSWIVVSPGIWYYQRFVRNESLFLMLAVGLIFSVMHAWRSANPAKWIIAACFFASALVAEKANSLFILFNGVFFLAMIFLYEKTRSRSPRHGRRSSYIVTRLWNSLKSQRYAWIIGLSIAFSFLSIVYTNGFQWQESFPEFYLRILKYWGGQHEEHRLYGEFHHYIPILFLYEPLVMGVLLIALGRLVFSRTRIIGASLFVASIVFGLWMGAVGNAWISPYLPDAPVSKEKMAGNLLGWLHMTQPWHLALSCGIGWVALWGGWTCLRQKRVFRAWLVLWTCFSFLQYSYAGEKVPWLALHIILPAILLAADLAAGWWRKNTRHFGRQQFAVAVLTLFFCLSLAQGFRLCFIHPVNPGELLIYNHTQFPLHNFAMDVRQDLLKIKPKPNASPRIILQGEAVWPMVWYTRGFGYTSGVEQKNWRNADYIVCDVDYAEKNQELFRNFRMEKIPFRQAFVPTHAPLHLFSSKPSTENEPVEFEDASENLEAESASEQLYGLGAWKTLVHYILTRRPWKPALTADPLDIYIGSKRNP